MPFIHVEINDKGERLSVGLEVGPNLQDLTDRERFLVENLVDLIQKASVGLAKNFLGATSHHEGAGATVEEAQQNLRKSQRDDKFFPLS